MHRRRIAIVSAFTFSVASLTPMAAHATSSPTTYYVSTASACTDLGPGTQAQPFCTVQQAVSVATVPGDTVMIAPGSYQEDVDITASGTAAAPITFEAQGGSGAEIGQTANALVISGASYVNLTGISASGSAQIENSSHVTLTRGSFRGSVSVTGTSSDVTLSKIVDNAGISTGIVIDSSGTGNVVTTSMIQADDVSPGITVNGSADAVITSNTVYGYCGTGIAIGDDAHGIASGAVIENNVIAEGVNAANRGNTNCNAVNAVGLFVQTAADEAGLTSDYNSVYPDLPSDSVVYEWAGQSYMTPAALDTATGQGAHDSIANPELYTDGTITGESSPLINSADANAPDEQSTDISGHARIADPNVPPTGAGTPGYDRGANQFIEQLRTGVTTAPRTAPSGGAVTVDAPTPVSSNWVGATFTFKYDFGDGSVLTSANLTEQHTYATAGTYNITVTVISDYGAETVEPTSISILSPVTFGTHLAVTPGYGKAIDATVNVTTDWPIISAVIKFGDGKTPQNVNLYATGSTAGGDIQYSYATPGAYTVSVTVADAGGDQQTVTQSVTTTGTDFTPYGPTRLLDTRTGLGGGPSQLANDGSIKLKIAGNGSIPANVAAVALNLTAVDATGNGYIQADTGTDTGTSNLNYRASAIYSNSVIAPVASDGTVTLRNFGVTISVKLDLLADVTGYFTASAASTYVFVPPTRLMDTRSGIGVPEGKLAAGKTDVLKVGVSPLPASGITAVSVNLTELDTTGSGYLSVYADGAALPNSSTVDWQGGTIKAANALVPVGADGKIAIYNGSSSGGSADVLVDVTGYFTQALGGAVYVPVAPYRVLDTRRSTAIAHDTSLPADLTGVDGMPGSPGPDDISVTGYVLNATVTQPQSAGWLTVSGSSSAPATSTVNWTGSNQTVANLAFSQIDFGEALDAGRYQVWFYNGGISGSVQAIADVMGYFTSM